MKHHRISKALAVASFATLSLSACGSDAATSEPQPTATETASTEQAEQASLVITDAWSREPAEGQDLGVVYATVSNPGEVDARILAATSPTSGDVQLHETTVSDEGTMSMSEQEQGFVVPAGGELTFEPGGAHIMLLGIDASTFPTDEVEVTLEIEDAEPISFAAEVRAIGEDQEGAMGEMDMEGMDHDDMDHDDMDHDEDPGDDAASGQEFAEDGAPEVSQLHALDEALEAGTLDADAQRPIVQEFVDYLEAQDPEEGSEQAALLDVMIELDTALEAGDLSAAAAAADTAHANAHSLEGTT